MFLLVHPRQKPERVADLGKQMDGQRDRHRDIQGDWQIDRKTDTAGTEFQSNPTLTVWVCGSVAASFRLSEVRGGGGGD